MDKAKLMSSKKTSMWVLRYLSQFLFAFTVLSFFLATSATNFDYIFYVAIVSAFALFFLKWKQTRGPQDKKAIIFWTVAILISMPFALLKLTLGTNDIEPIILFFRDNGMEEVNAVWRGSFEGKVFTYLIMYYLLFATGYYFNKYLHGFHYILLGSGVAYLVMNPFNQYMFRKVFPDPILSTFIIKDNFKKPIFINSPSTKKNLILVYLESFESTYENVEQTAVQYSTIKPFMEDALVFDNVMQTAGSTYSIAGIVSSQCGVPLIPRGLNNGIFLRKNSGIEVKDFYKDIECLGDKLSQDGYTLSYMNGADARKYSKRSFLSTHGYTRIFDEFSVTDAERKGRDNLWGLNDEVLYENLRKEVDFLKSQPEPFVLNYLTISTHGPDGYLDTDCDADVDQDTKIPAAIKCSVSKLMDFYSYIEESGLAENTIFVVMNDHLARKNTLYDELENQPWRKNLFFVKGAGQRQTINKLASPLDIYPTLLELVGYEIKNGQANMGVSLLSDNQSLIQKFGYPEDVSRRFNSNHALGEFLWINPSQ